MHIYKNILILLVVSIIGCAAEKNYLPVEINSFKLRNKLSGTEAETHIDRLHQGNVASDKNEIGFYMSGVRKMIIYVSYYRNYEIAIGEYEKMINKISHDHSVFINPDYITINDKKIYRCFGLGQSHFVFYNGKQLIWLSVDSHIGKDLVEEYLELIT